MNRNNGRVSGYVTDTTYADTFFRELSPAWINYVAALNGAEPIPLDAPFRYLELGCGFGTSCVVNAAAFPQASFDACDFNASHIRGGAGHAAQLDLPNIRFHSTSFERLLDAELDQYEFIVMHGVYSWVDARTRRVLRGLVERLLRPGGLMYVSYNALPGWSAELALRKLLVTLTQAESGTAAERASHGVERMTALRDAGLRYFTANPGAAAALDAYQRGEGHYLAHEFMNDAWEPFYAADIADEFARIGLSLVGNATLPHNHLPLMVDGPLANAIGDLPNVYQQQVVADFAVNQRFRRDVFIRAIGAEPRPEYFERTPIGCVTDTEDLGPTVRVPRGEIRFQDPFIQDVRALFAQGSWSFGEAISQLTTAEQDWVAIARNVLFLVAGGALAPFARVTLSGSTQPTRLANPMIERAVHGERLREGRPVIPSGVYGNGVEVEVETLEALRQWSGGGTVSEAFLSRELPRFARLGIVE